MSNDLDAIVQSARDAFAQAATPADLENAKAQFTGKSGRITELMKGMAALSVEEKKTRGAAINQAKQAIEAALAARRQQLAEAELEAQLKAEALDVSLPGRVREPGGLHPVSLTMERIEQIFASMGFDVADGPEIESDWHSFTSLNNPPNHPARSMQDTFYVDIQGDDGIHYNLRPHTSPMQVRYARMHQPPIKVIAPGRTYRVDSDATHSPMFHQVEGLWIDEHVSFADLKGVFELAMVAALIQHEGLDVAAGWDRGAFATGGSTQSAPCAKAISCTSSSSTSARRTIRCARAPKPTSRCSRRRSRACRIRR